MTDELRTESKIRSIWGSNAIEGIFAAPPRLRRISLHAAGPDSLSEQEIAGYRDAIEFIHEGASSVPFDEDTILKLHRMIYSYSDLTLGGKYKQEDNVIVSCTPFGYRVLFEPVPAEETEESVSEMLSAYNLAVKNYDIEPLLLIPCVILDYLCIHPFPDGNGRTSRLLTLLLMYRHGMTVQRFASIEGAIYSIVDDYYSSLQASDEGWHDGVNDYIPFIQIFLESLEISMRDLEERCHSLQE